LDEAELKYNEALDIDQNFGSEPRIAYIRALKQDYPEAMRLIDLYIQRAPSAGIKAEGYIWLAVFRFIQGQRENAFGDLGSADEWADKAGNDVRKAAANYTRSWMFYELGNLELSAEHLQKWADVLLGLNPDSKNWQIWHHFCLGLVYVKQERMDEAKSMLDKIESIQVRMETPDVPTMAKFRHKWLHAEILLAEDLWDEAISVYTSIEYPPIPQLRVDPIMIYNMPFIDDFLARAYHKSGRLDDAIAEYERKIKFDPQSDNRRLIHPKYYYFLAKLYEEKGNAAKAIENYEKFLELWKDADPGLPELEDAKKRLASLRNPRGKSNPQEIAKSVCFPR
jgi:tetratricopeptide (TPR) repeat protein